ncbi:MAG: hypothetical protein KF694_09450 [Mesorhizobium sp.]|nr:hypothetical protein [Mesorhizobium sp.]
MNQILKRAVTEVESLSDKEQEELGHALMEMALRKKLEAMFAASDAEGGETLHDEVFDRLLTKIRG